MAMNSLKIFIDYIRQRMSGKENRSIYLSAHQISELQAENSCSNCGRNDAYLIFKESILEDETDIPIANFNCDNCEHKVRVELK